MTHYPEYYYDHDDAIKESPFADTADVAARMHNLEVPYMVHIDKDGTEHWAYLVVKAGRDEEGVYQVVTEGPAQGERVYLDT